MATDKYLLFVSTRVIDNKTLYFGLEALGFIDYLGKFYSQKFTAQFCTIFPNSKPYENKGHRGDPLMDYTGRLRPKGVPFSEWRYIKG